MSPYVVTRGNSSLLGFYSMWTGK